MKKDDFSWGLFGVVSFQLIIFKINLKLKTNNFNRLLYAAV